MQFDILTFLRFQCNTFCIFNTQKPIPITKREVSNSLLYKYQYQMTNWRLNLSGNKPTSAGAERNQYIFGSSWIHTFPVAFYLLMWRIIHLTVIQQKFPNEQAFETVAFLKERRSLAFVSLSGFKDLEGAEHIYVYGTFGSCCPRASLL